MELVTNNYTFGVVRKKMSNTHYFYTIGNLQNKSHPCIEFMVSKEAHGWHLTIEHLQYHASCSLEMLEKKNGTREMLQGAICAIVKKHPKIVRIELTDASFFTTSSGHHIPLPEYRMITRGKTWYQEYFGAMPLSTDLRIKLKLYNKSRELALEDLNNQELSDKTLIDIMNRYDLKEISHRAWFIPLEEVLTWKYQGKFRKSPQSGGAWNHEHPMTYKFRFVPEIRAKAS